MAVYIDKNGIVDGACGLNDIITYTRADHGWGGKYNLETATPQELRGGGSHLTIMCFINNAICKDAYTIARKRFKLLYQSPPYPNSRHRGRKFFICLFDISEAP